MVQRGRGKAILALGLMWAVCLAGTGCSLSISFFTRPEPAQDTAKAHKETAPKPPPPAEGFLPVSATEPAGQPRPADLERDPGNDHPKPREADRPDGTAGATSPALLAPLGGPGPIGPPARRLPTELELVTHPPYLIEPPDVLLIDAVRLIPRPPYRIEPLDVLTIQATETFPNQPIAGIYPVAPDGTVALGFTYGVVRVTGMTLEEAQAAIREHLSRRLRNPQVALGLATFRGLQQIRGEHLVRPDGTVSLGTYGCVGVAGMTLDQARVTIERYLSQFLQDPQISVDVLAYNSKAYYVIADGAGYGQLVFKFPSTGKETVLDAINNIGGIPQVGSKRRIWVARPAPANHECLQILPVDWLAITQGGSTRTNYQLFPGDRVYIKADAFIAADGILAKVFAPIERILGITLLGASTVRAFQSTSGNNTGGFIFGF